MSECDGFLYTRKSRALGDPDEDPHILAHQRDSLLRLADQLGVSVRPDRIIEEIGSGERLDDRVRLAALLEGWERRPPPRGSLLMVTGVERVTRGDLLEAGLIARKLQQAGVLVRTLSQCFDLSKPDDYYLFSTLAIAGNYGLNRYRHDVMLRKDQLTRNGEIVTGAAPYGYRWERGRISERGRLVTEPKEFAVVQAIFAEALHTSIERLAQRYGLPRATVAYLLHNPVYTGYPHRHSKSRLTAAGRTSSRMLPEHQWTVRAERKGSYEPAVSVAGFYQVQAALSERFRERAKTGEADGWCRRLLVLEGWDARVQLGAEGKERRLVYNFVCRKTGKRTCYPRAPIHEAAKAALLSALQDTNLLRAALESEQRRRQREASGLDQERLIADLARLRGTLAELKIEAASDSEDRLALQTAQDRVKTQIRSTQELLGQSLHEGDTGRLTAVLGPVASIPAEAFEEVWEECSPHEKAAIAGSLIERIVVRITPTTWRRPVEREIVEVRYQAWYDSQSSVP